MLKVIYGSDVKLLELELTKEIKKDHFDSIKIIKDLTNFTDIYLFTHQINLFEENKAFVFYNSEIFSNLDNSKQVSGLILTPVLLGTLYKIIGIDTSFAIAE